MNSNGLDDLARRLADSVPESLRAFGRDLEGNFKAVLQANLANSIWSRGRISTCKPRSWSARKAKLTAHGSAPEGARSETLARRKRQLQRRGSCMGTHKEVSTVFSRAPAGLRAPHGAGRSAFGQWVCPHSLWSDFPKRWFARARSGCAPHSSPPDMNFRSGASPSICRPRICPRKAGASTCPLPSASWRPRARFRPRALKRSRVLRRIVIGRRVARDAQAIAGTDRRRKIRQRNDFAGRQRAGGQPAQRREAPLA